MNIHQKQSRNLAQKIRTCLDFIQKNQDSDGCFAHLAFPENGATLSSARICRTTFFAAQIGMILGALPEPHCSDPRVDMLATTIEDFLESQIDHEQYGSFNYWHTGSPEYKTVSLPNDTDDTFCAYRALFERNPHRITGKKLADLVSVLIQHEVSPGGPYYTWMNNHIPPWENIDLGVNANVLFFLRHYGLASPEIETYLRTKVSQNDFSSVFYPKNTILFFIARSLGIGSGELLTSHIHAAFQASTHWGEKIMLALAHYYSSGTLLIPLDELQSLKIEDLTVPFPFSVDPSFGSTAHWASCSSLQAAFFCALASITEHHLRQQTKNKHETISKKSHRKLIEKQIRIYFYHASDPETAAFYQSIRSYLHHCIEKTTDAQMYELPFMLNDGIKGTKKPTRPELAHLGFLTLCGWAAYRIYDDIFDEAKRTKELPIANILLEIALSGYKAYLGEDLVRRIFHTMEAAIWNGSNGNSQHLHTSVHQKSSMHLLCPLAVLVACGFSPTSVATKQCTEYFIHYLSARQLNDDAHDWFEDYSRGQTQYVTQNVINRFIELYQRQPTRQDEKALREIFWNESIDQVEKEILSHTHKARKIVERSSWLRNSEILQSFLTPLEQAAQKATRERTLMRDFLQYFQGN